MQHNVNMLIRHKLKFLRSHLQFQISVVSPAVSHIHPPPLHQPVATKIEGKIRHKQIKGKN